MSAQNLSSDQFRTYYHGTLDEHVKSIKKSGLRAGSYLADHPGTSDEYGKNVFKVTIPDNHEFAENENEYWENNQKHAGYKVSLEVPGQYDLVTTNPKELKLEGPKSAKEWL